MSDQKLRRPDFTRIIEDIYFRVKDKAEDVLLPLDVNTLYEFSRFMTKHTYTGPRKYKNRKTKGEKDETKI